MNKRVIAGIVIVVLLGGGGWWFMSRRAGSAASGAVRYVEDVVTRSTLRSQISGSGPAKSVNGVTVRPNQSGTIAQILAKDGDKVEADQPVVILENDSLLSSLAQAQFDLESASANLQNLVSPQSTAVRAQELKVESARLTLQQRQEEMANLEVKAPIGGVIASVGAVTGGTVNTGSLLFTIFDEATPTMTIQLPQETATRLSNGQTASVTLAGHGSFTGTVARLGGTASPASGSRDSNVTVAIDLPAIPGVRPGMVGQVTIERPGLTYRIQANGSIENDATEVRAKVSGTAERIDVSEGDVVTAGQMLLTIENDNLAIQLAQAENDLKTQEQELQNLLNPAQDPSRQLFTYQQKLQQAQLTLSQRETDVADLTVKAPVGGTISSVNVAVGDKVSTGTDLFRVANYSTMEVTISVDELDVAMVKVGQPAEITLDALPGRTYTGKVSKVNPEGVFKNDIATFEVTVAIEKADGIMAGMNSTVLVTVEERQNVLSVPVTAVTVGRGMAFVQVLENGQPVRKEVGVGLKTDDRYEIISGLNEGDKVITATINGTNASAPQMRTPFSGGMGGGAPTGGQRPTGTVPAGTGGQR